MQFRFKNRKLSEAAADGAVDGAVTGETAASTETAATDASVETAGETGAPISTESNANDAAATEYTDFTFPEGFIADETVLSSFKETALKAGLTQEQAQALLGVGAEMQQKIFADYAAKQEQQVADWAAAAKADKEYGGVKFEENMGLVAKAANEFISPELKEELNRTGLGNHPELIRTFYRIGKAISEDSFVSGGNHNKGAPRSAAEILYPNQ